MNTYRPTSLFYCIMIIALYLAVVFTGYSTPANAQEELVQVEVNKGKMIRLDRNATTVMIANPAVADIQIVSPKMIYVQGRAIGETSLYAMDAGEVPILDATVEVTHNLSKLQRSISDILPTADIQLRTVDGGLVINGFVDSPYESERINSLARSFVGEEQAVVNMLNTAGSDQVTLMVKVAEVSRNELKRFGINLAAAFNPGNIAFSVLQGRTFLDAAGSVLRSGDDNSIVGSFSDGSTVINGILDALEQEGLVSVLAEPSLTTTSGKPADFLAGGEFPIPVVSGDGDVSVDYRPFGISLNFTPTVLSRDKISLTVSPEVSTISQLDSLQLGGVTTFIIPSIQTRRASTTVELGSGQTFAIAGLLKNDRSNNIDKFPVLGDMPVLGGLFRSQEFQNDQTELVILVTPYIVRPVDEKEKIQSPLDGFTPPNDMERILLGKLYREQAVAGEVHLSTDEAAPKLYGEAGFIMEN